MVYRSPLAYDPRLILIATEHYRVSTNRDETYYLRVSSCRLTVPRKYMYMIHNRLLRGFSPFLFPRISVAGRSCLVGPPRGLFRFRKGSAGMEECLTFLNDTRDYLWSLRLIPHGSVIETRPNCNLFWESRLGRVFLVLSQFAEAFLSTSLFFFLSFFQPSECGCIREGTGAMAQQTNLLAHPPLRKS